jgi:hypothetical protein
MASVNWLFNDIQGMAFEAWWRDSLVDGSKWFECPLDVPLGYQEYTARFSDVYSGPNRVGPDLWAYSAELEIKERPLVPIGWGEFPEYILNARIFDIAVNEYWPDHDWQTNMDVGDYAINYQWPNA